MMSLLFREVYLCTPVFIVVLCQFEYLHLNLLHQVHIYFLFLYLFCLFACPTFLFNACTI